MLLFLIKHSRPDLCNAVRELSKCLDGAGQAAYKEMLRVIKYALDTRNRGLKIAPTIGEIEWSMLVYTDSDWAGDKDNRRSVGGYMIFVNGVLVRLEVEATTSCITIKFGSRVLCMFRSSEGDPIYCSSP